MKPWLLQAEADKEVLVLAVGEERSGKLLLRRRGRCRNYEVFAWGKDEERRAWLHVSNSYYRGVLAAAGTASGCLLWAVVNGGCGCASTKVIIVTLMAAAQSDKICSLCSSCAASRHFDA